jgi:hypothetical protein
MSDRDTKSQIVTVRLNEKESSDLEDLAAFWETTKSEVLVEGMRMVRDLKQVVAELLQDDPDLAHVLKNCIVPGILNANYRRGKVGEVAGKILMGLIKKDFFGAGRRAKLALKLLQE